ncbi:MAG: tail fiber domain-containing protein, partial [Bacteroidota bacterium]
DGGTSEIAARGDVRPTADNTYDLGTATFRFDDVYATSGVVNTSDARLKRNVLQLDYGLAEVMQMKPVIYQWRNDPTEETKIGLLAQDLQEIVPEVVKTHDYKINEESGEIEPYELDKLGVYYSDLIPVLINAVQEQQAMIERQQQELDRLRQEVDALKK